MIRPGESVVVVGGGLLGLTVAWRLRAAGADVTVVEAAPELGGLAAAWTIPTAAGDVTWDRFYHVILESDSHWRALLAELGVDASIAWTTTRTGYARDGRVSPVGTPREFLALPGLSLAAKARLVATLARGAAMRSPGGLEAMPVEEWLTRWSGRATFERFWVPLLEAKLGDAWHEANAAFIWATIRRLTAARRAGVASERFGAVPGGAAAVLDAFGRESRARGIVLRTGTPVETIRADGAGRVTVATAEGGIPADHVVVTTTPRVGARLCPDLPAAMRAVWEGVAYQGVVCVSLVLDRALSPYYLTYLMDPSPFTAVVEMTTLIPPAWVGGHALVYLPKYAPPADPLFDLPDADVVERFVAGLRRIHPVPDGAVLGARVARAREVFPVPVLRASEQVPPVASGIPGIHLVSSAQIVNGTLNADETVATGDAAAARLLGRVATTA
ncbi:MAG: FAD-dependent oxidoreductase [Acidimicrobiia bacterium]